jgi:hypothetical protein
MRRLPSARKARAAALRKSCLLLIYQTLNFLSIFHLTIAFPGCIFVLSLNKQNNVSFPANLVTTEKVAQQPEG